MLPGFRFLFAAIILSMSVLVFGLGATALLRAIPRFVRDPLYRWLARNRYRWFGRTDQCLVPAPDQAARFLG